MIGIVYQFLNLMAEQCDESGLNRQMSHQMIDEFLQLAQIPALKTAIAVGSVLPHDRITSVPVGLRLRVEPVDMTGLLAYLLDHPTL